MKETMSKYKRKKMDDDEPYEKGTMRGKVDKMPKKAEMVDKADRARSKRNER